MVLIFRDGRMLIHQPILFGGFITQVEILKKYHMLLMLVLLIPGAEHLLTAIGKLEYGLRDVLSLALRALHYTTKIIE